MIDLHTHSTFSDGTLAPAALVELADTLKIEAVALTDHDTIDGIPEAIDAARHRAVRFVPGVELSCEIEHGALHIIGLFIDHTHPGLNALLDEATANRNARNAKIADRFCDLGMPLTLAEVEEKAIIGTVGRPHFAAVLTEKGYTHSIREAFLKYLGKNGAAYYPKVRIAPDRAIRTISEAGGLSVLAHPDQTHLGGKALADYLQGLRDSGLDAMETHYSGYTVSRSRKYRKLAIRLGLMQSGGSDFHGGVKPGLALGAGPGDLHVPSELLPVLERAAQARQAAKTK